MLSEIRTVEYLLEQWSCWARINRGLALYFPSSTNFGSLRVRGGLGTTLTDSEAETVDAVVSSLRLDSRKAHDALALYYIAGMPYRKIGKELSVHHRTASDFTEQGRMYVKAALRFGAPNSTRL